MGACRCSHVRVLEKDTFCMKIPELEGFEILEKLGEGGMAAVWKARQISLDRIVAIKVLSHELAAAADDVDRFQQEARAAARLKHPGIVQVYDARAENGVYYFVMEYVAGYTVGDWIRRKGALSEEDALIVTDCVAEAMDDAWRTASLIHCDIKPDNIIIDADGTVKVADLGLSRTISAMSAGGKLDEVMGTPAYISPEQAEGRADLDCRADIYSLGAMLYHMLTGKLMFQGQADDEVMLLQVTTHAVAADELNPKLCKAVCELLDALLKKDRDDRPRTWDDVKVLLRRTRANMPRLPGAGPVQTATQVKVDHERLMQHRQGARPPAAADSTHQQPPTNRRLLLLFGILIAAVLVVFWVRARTPQAPPGLPAPAGPVQDPAQAAVPTNREPAGVTPPVTDTVEENAREMYEFARQWHQENPHRLQEAVKAFRKVAIQTAGTKYALMAEDMIRNLVRQSENEVAQIMERLAEQAQSLIDAGDFLGAAALYDGYEGPRQWETGERRQDVAAQLRRDNARKGKQRSQVRKRADAKRQELVDLVPPALLDDGLPTAVRLARSIANHPDAGPYAEELNAVLALLERAEDMDQRIIDSFLEQVDTQVSLDLVQGRRTLVITGVDGERIIARMQLPVGSGVASSEVILTLGDLSSREKLARMGDEAVPEVALVKGLMASRSKAYEHAHRFFDLVGYPLNEPLVSLVEARAVEGADGAARESLRGLMRDVGIAVPAGSTMREWVKAVGRARMDPRKVAYLSQALDLYEAEYGDTPFSASAEPVIRELRSVLKVLQGT